VAFDRVAREGSFSRAALALGIGQPAVSSRIQALERALGGALFRRGRQVAITPLGESFLPYVRRSIEVLTEGVEAGRLVQQGRGGRVSIGALNSLAGAVVGPALARFMRACPNVGCLVRAGYHESILALLLDGIVDLALLSWPCTPALESELRVLFVLDEPVVLVTPPGHPLARRRRVTREDVVRLGRPFYRLRWWQAHHPAVVAIGDESGSSLDLAMETARHLIGSGLGVGFFPRAAIDEDLSSGRLVAVEVRDLAPITRQSALVRRVRHAGPPVADKLVALLRGEAQSRGFLRRR
jgi:DNA-binding transcriptional LysR family regulator